MEGIIWAHYDRFGFQFAICQICGQHCSDLKPLSRHMLYNNTPLRIEHHKIIEQLTGRTVIQLRSKGGLDFLNSALTKELKRVKNNSRKRAVYFIKQLRSEQKCVLCGTVEKLELDHIDGNALNNEISNLRWLCSPCHHKVH